MTEHIKESAKKTNLPYLRLSRSTAAEREIAEHEWMIHTVADTQECVKLLSSLPGNILLTTGSKERELFTQIFLTNEFVPGCGSQPKVDAFRKYDMERK